MSPRLRFGLWVAAVAGCALSPVLFRLIAPWAGAAWQCLCLGGILALYATTPADAIKLTRWESKLLIAGGMLAWPALCIGEVTTALVVTCLGVVILDHLPVSRWRRSSVGTSRRPATIWSWQPGVLGDWLSCVVLWSPLVWWATSLGDSGQAMSAAAIVCAFWVLAIQHLEVLDRIRLALLCLFFSLLCVGNYAMVRVP